MKKVWWTIGIIVLLILLVFGIIFPFIFTRNRMEHELTEWSKSYTKEDPIPADDTDHQHIKKVLLDLGMDQRVIDHMEEEDFIFYEECSHIQGRIHEYEDLQLHHIFAQHGKDERVRVTVDAIWKTTPFFREKDVFGAATYKILPSRKTARGYILYDQVTKHSRQPQIIEIPSSMFHVIDRDGFSGMAAIVKLPRRRLTSTGENLLLHMEYVGLKSFPTETINANHFASYDHVTFPLGKSNKLVWQNLHIQRKSAGFHHLYRTSDIIQLEPR